MSRRENYPSQCKFLCRQKRIEKHAIFQSHLSSMRRQVPRKIFLKNHDQLETKKICRGKISAFWTTLPYGLSGLIPKKPGNTVCHQLFSIIDAQNDRFAKLIHEIFVFRNPNTINLRYRQIFEVIFELVGYTFNVHICISCIRSGVDRIKRATDVGVASGSFSSLQIMLKIFLQNRSLPTVLRWSLFLA